MAERLTDKIRNLLADRVRGVQYAPVRRTPTRTHFRESAPRYRTDAGTLLALFVFGGVAFVIGALGLIASVWFLLVLWGLL